MFLTASIVSTSGLRNDFVVGVDLGYYAKKVQNIKGCEKFNHSGRKDRIGCNRKLNDVKECNIKVQEWIAKK